MYPLLSIAYPKQLSNFLVGWLNAFKAQLRSVLAHVAQAGGWLPKWASPGYRDSMVGTFADVVLADAMIKNISGDHWNGIIRLNQLQDMIYIYGTALGTPTPPPGDGHGSLPRPLWEWVGWLWMGGNAG